MTLEEAKDILEYSDKDYFMETLYETYHQSNVKRFEKAIDTVLKALEEPEDIYPLTIIKDRYSGAYSHGIYTAWNLDFEEIPTEINDEDVICHGFWLENKIIVGKGNTPIEAMHNLIELIKE